MKLDNDVGQLKIISPLRFKILIVTFSFWKILFVSSSIEDE